MPTAREPAATSRTHASEAVRVVDALVGQRLVDPGRRAEAVDVVGRSLAGTSERTLPLRRRLAELAGYVGAAFVVAAIALLVADQWRSLPVAARSGLLYGAAVLLFAAGVVLGLTGGGLADLRAGTQPVRRRLAGVLFTVAAGAGAAATVVWLVHALHPGTAEVDRTPVVGLAGSLVLVALGVAGYLLAPTLLGQAVVAVGAGYATAFALDTVADVAPVPLGLLLLGLGVVWLLLAERGWWREVTAGRVVGCLFLLVGAQVPVGSATAWVGYVATLTVAVAGFALYVVRRAWPYLAVGVAGVSLVVPEALLDWTEGSLGTAGVLLVSGVTLLGASLFGMRLRSTRGRSTQRR
ncbi:MAG: hypothetical protein ACXVXM_03600 [Nocardioidaceae bacterium]